MRKFLILLTVFLFMGCSIPEKIIEVTGNDLQRTSELAGKYGKPEVKQCADFLVASIGKLNNEETGLQELLKEDTSGVFSSALKSVLVKEAIASLNDPARAEAFRKEFDVACSAVAGQIVLNLARDAAKVAKRVN